LGDITVQKSLSFHQNLNHQAAIIIQIESLEAIKNLDAILTECGDQIDGCWLGSFDARVSMGLPSFWGDEPEWLEAVAMYESTLAKHNKPASGLAVGDPEQKKAMAKGRSFIVTGSDMFALMGQMGELAFARENFPQMDFANVYKKI
jgi:4-hydroxy-2-oxoheptanedioate aldolase